MNLLIIALFLIGLLPLCAGEVFTSMAHMENLVDTEKLLARSLRDYISEEERRLSTLKRFSARVEETLTYINRTDVTTFIGNPVNTYLMLRRFNVDWRSLEELLNDDHSKDFLDSFENVRSMFPNEEDQVGAINALFRLQNTYKLQSNMLAKGVIPGVHSSFLQALNINEVFEIGQHAYDINDWAHAGEWLATALRSLGGKSRMLSVTKASVMDHLAYAEFKRGNIKEAFQLTMKLAGLMPTDERIKKNLEHYRHLLLKMNPSGKTGDTGSLDNDSNDQTGYVPEKYVREREEVLRNYESLCRGETRPQTKHEKSKMRCWYKSNDPVLRLKPQKVERVWVEPEIFILRDILSPKEIQSIKDTASPMLSRATIQDPITGKLRYADYRVSKSAWLSPHDHDFVARMQIRAQASTGLDLQFAEQLQIANYGIGGHYEPHFDHARDDEDKFSDLDMGNRIATILFYLTDVEAGGATVFTIGKAAVFPSKGDAVFWFNLKRNGNGNSDTRHAACPVLVGHKWVSNWWIHEYGQVFRRKCALHEHM